MRFFPRRGAWGVGAALGLRCSAMAEPWRVSRARGQTATHAPVAGVRFAGTRPERERQLQALESAHLRRVS